MRIVDRACLDEIRKKNQSLATRIEKALKTAFHVEVTARDGGLSLTCLDLGGLGDIKSPQTAANIYLTRTDDPADVGSTTTRDGLIYPSGDFQDKLAKRLMTLRDLADRYYLDGYNCFHTQGEHSDVQVIYGGDALVEYLLGSESNVNFTIHRDCAQKNKGDIATLVTTANELTGLSRTVKLTAKPKKPKANGSIISRSPKGVKALYYTVMVGLGLASIAAYGFAVLKLSSGNITDSLFYLGSSLGLSLPPIVTLLSHGEDYIGDLLPISSMLLSAVYGLVALGSAVASVISDKPWEDLALTGVLSFFLAPVSYVAYNIILQKFYYKKR
ncbi:hypothetical protein JW930_05260 [Candidatus Woesearchaeota archaeon]|nr:hypothetical protein [Candidatus Woesearchaeota archaeon]